MTTQSFTMEKAKILATMKAKVPTHSWLHTKRTVDALRSRLQSDKPETVSALDAAQNTMLQLVRPKILAKFSEFHKFCIQYSIFFIL